MTNDKVARAPARGSVGRPPRAKYFLRSAGCPGSRSSATNRARKMDESAGSEVPPPRRRRLARGLRLRKGPRGRETELLTNSAWAGVRGVTCVGEDAARGDLPIERWLPGTRPITWSRLIAPARCAVQARAPEPAAIREGASSAARGRAFCARNSWALSDPPAPIRSIPRTSSCSECSQANGCASMRRRIHNPREQWTKRCSRRGATPKPRRRLACKRAQSSKQRSNVELGNVNSTECHIHVSESPR